MKKKVEFSIIIVNYYSEQYIFKCIESIEKFVDEEVIEIIIVSNSKISKEDIASFSIFPGRLKIHQQPNNSGFAKACNKGARIATGTYLFFLNPDTILRNNIFYLSKKKFSEDQSIGLIGPRTETVDGVLEASVKNDFSVAFYIQMIFPFMRSIFPSHKKCGHIFLRETKYVQVVNGHALILKKKVFENVLGMNEQYFMYWEEHDLCLKIRESGLKVLFLNEAKLTHIQGTSTAPFKLKMDIEKHNSQRKFIEEYYPNYKFINRLSGVIAYTFSFIVTLIIFDKKASHYYLQMLKWYSLRYK